MVFFLTMPDGAGHIRLLVERFGRQFGRNLVEMSYPQLLERGSAPPGAYVFTDQQVMNPSQKRIAGWIRSQIMQFPKTHRVFNDPEGQLGRYDLLKALEARGELAHRVFRLDEEPATLVRFPAFLRIEDDHMGPRSGLLHSWSEVEQAANRLILAGFTRHRILVVEFLETKGSDGLYRKYGAFRIGERIVCQHILHSDVWLSKRHTTLRTAELVDASDLFFTENRHAHWLMPYFELAKIQYGRIDYGMTGERIHVWEINDNPTYVGRGGQRLSKVSKGEVFRLAFEALTDGLGAGADVPLIPNLGEAACWVAGN